MLILIFFLQSIFQSDIPINYKRIPLDSYGRYIHNNWIKKGNFNYIIDGSQTKRFDFQYNIGLLDSSKLNNFVIGVLRVRFEYFFNTKQFSRIYYDSKSNRRFYFHKPYSFGTFLKYFDVITKVFGKDDLISITRPTSFDSIKVGDIFLVNDKLSSTFIVLDIIQNSEGHKKLILGQCSTSDRVVKLVCNNNDYWISVDDEIVTSDFIFKSSQLRTWKN
jgi:hypothetical protein